MREILIVATYDPDTDAESLDELVEMLRPNADEVERHENHIRCVSHRPAGRRSKYGAVGEALGQLHDLFDPVQRDEFFRPWPTTLTVSIK